MRRLNIDEDLLKYLYLDCTMSTTKIGELLGCSDSAVLKYLKKYNIETRTISESVSGELNHNFGRYGVDSTQYGKHLSEETKAKVSANHADNSGMNHPMFGKHHSEETRALMSAKHLGELNHNFGKYGELSSSWKMDRDSLKTPENSRVRTSLEYREWRLMVFGRDSFTCQLCRKRGSYLEAHHLFSFSDWEELRFDLDNGQTLCTECHDKHGNKGTYTHRR